MSEATLPVGTRIGRRGRYHILRLVSTGRSNQIYEADDIYLDRRCTIKQLVLQPQWGAETRAVATEALLNEGNILRALQTPGHASIPRYYDYLPDLHCLVLQFVDGKSLYSLLKQRISPFSERAALLSVRDVASALVYMHGRAPKPILHLDVKLENLLLDSSNHTWLVDFGLSQVAGNSRSRTAIGGTRFYAPPEQWNGDVEPRSDIYSLSVTLFLLLTNVPSSALDQYISTAFGSPDADPESHDETSQPTPKISKDIEKLLQRGLAKEIARRPTAQEFLDEIEHLLTYR